ncbi:hypothetical protein FOCC_FOCC007324 [Frankliniella occidentalis]|nr:hypothetical protein FOCC_FOCC007324 [Frankliniella occidentalis]
MSTDDVCHRRRATNCAGDGGAAEAARGVWTSLKEAGEKAARSSKTAGLWWQYFYLVALLRLYIRAKRQGVKECVKAMLPYFHATGYIHSAKSAHLYVQQMEELSGRCKEAAEEGLFTVRRTDDFLGGGGGMDRHGHEARLHVRPQGRAQAEVVDNSSIVVLNTVDEEAMEKLFRCVAVPADGMGNPIIRVLTDYVMICQNKYMWAGVDLNKMQPFFELKGTNSHGNSAKVRMSRDELRVLCEKDIQDFIAEGIRKGKLGDFIDCGGLRLTIVNLSDKKQMFNVRIRRKDIDTQCIDLALKSWECIFYFKKYIEYLANQKKEAIPVIIRLIQQLSKEAAEIFFEEGHGFAYLNKKENEVQIVKFKEECSDFNVEVFNQLGDVDFKKVRFEIRRWPKAKLLAHYGEGITVAQGVGKDVLNFSGFVGDFFEDVWYQKQNQAGEKNEKERTVELAARVFCPDYEYPSVKDLAAEAERTTTPLLKLFLGKLITTKEVDKTKVIRKQQYIAQCVMLAIQPKSFISPLLLVLGASLHKEFGSKHLVQILDTFGACHSYNEVKMFEYSLLDDAKPGRARRGEVRRAGSGGSIISWAERTGDWELHLEPLYYAAGHHLYARSTRLYVQTMEDLDGDLNTAAMKGFFTVRRTSDYWAGVWTDMVVEQDIMCALNRQALHKVTTALEGYCGLKCVTSEQHVDLRESRVSRDQADRQRLVSWLEAHHPFDNSEGIRCISTGVRGKKSTAKSWLPLARKRPTPDPAVESNGLFVTMSCLGVSTAKLQEYLHYGLCWAPPALF